MATLGVGAPRVSADRRHRQPDRTLRWAAWAFAFGAIVHNADHLRRGFSSVSPSLVAVGTLGSVISVAAIVLVLSGHRLGPLAAVSAGFPLAVGFIAVHWLPRWSALSDPFVEGHPSRLSIVASLLEIAGALWLAVAGWLVLRRAGGLASAVRLR